MKRVGLMIAVLMAWQTPQAAEIHAAGHMHISAPWARELPPVSTNGAAYLSMTNTGKTADRLVSASSPIAERVMLHETTMYGGVMRMRPVPSLVIAPHETTVLEPGGLHLMLMKLKKPLVAGKHFPVTLEFAEGGSVDVEVMVTQGGGMGHGDHASHGTQSEHGEHAVHAAAGHQMAHERHGDSVDVAPSQAPSVRLHLRVNDAGVPILALDTERFRFSREHVDGERVMGEGHAHLYIDGKKISRVYAPRTELPALRAGVHEILVSLHANDHAHYSVGGVPVADRIVVQIRDGGFEPGGKGKARLFALDLHHGKLHGGRQTLRATQGDAVSMRWTSDAPRELHLHGYDIEAQVGPDSPVTMRFDAVATGRFPVESHGDGDGGSGAGHGHEPVLFLEVLPR